MNGVNRNNNPFLNLNSKRIMINTPEFEIIEKAKEVELTKKTQSVKDSLVGNGSWNTQQIKDAGLEVPSKYFIGVYTDYYRFNPDNITKDFPNKSIQTLQDLQQAIEAKEAEDAKDCVGNGSWSTEEIAREGIDLVRYSEYFIGVYTNFYRFNPDSIMRDFPGKHIQKLSDLKEAIDSLEDNSDNDINTALANQNLTLVTNDEYENENGRIVATDSEGNYYDYNAEKKEFVLRTFNGIKESILAGNDYFSVTDLTRFVNRVKENLDPLFIHGYLEPYRDSLYNLNCPSELHYTIMNELETELISYYVENREIGLSEHLNQVFKELKDKYLKTDLQKFEERLEGDEFDREVRADELWQYIDEYSNLVIEDLRANSNFPEGFINLLSGFIPPGEIYDVIYEQENINLKNILILIQSCCNELIKFPSNECYIKNPDKSYTQSFVSTIFLKTYINSNDNIINDFSYLQFQTLLIQYIAENYGMIDDLQRYGRINLANIPDTNDNGNWLDELYNIANEFVHLNDPEEINNATTIDINTLFDYKNELSLYELIEELENAIISGDPGLNKFSAIVNNVLGKFNIYNNYDKEDLIKCIIMLMNKAAGNQNSYPVTLSRDTIEQLNEKGIFEELDRIINSDELRDLYYFGVDGYIDDFGQGNTGDCWLLAAIITLNSSEAGKQILKDSIVTDANGNITVTFKGIGISYTISPEEMEEARIAPAYSHGDNDVLALELATEKLRRDITAGKITLRYGNMGAGSEDDGSYGKGIHGGLEEYMLYYLTGNRANGQFSPNQESDTLEFLNSIYDDIQSGKVVGYFGFLISGSNQVTTVDGKPFYKVTGHAYSISSMTRDTITIVNPWHSDTPYTLTWEEFAKLMPYINTTSTELQEHEYNASWNNAVDYESTFTINGKKYSINDILSSDKDINIQIENPCDFINVFMEIINFSPNNSYNGKELLDETIWSYLANAEKALAKGKDTFTYCNYFTGEYETVDISYEISGIQDYNDCYYQINLSLLIRKFLSFIP